MHGAEGKGLGYAAQHLFDDLCQQQRFVLEFLDCLSLLALFGQHPQCGDPGVFDLGEFTGQTYGHARVQAAADGDEDARDAAIVQPAVEQHGDVGVRLL